MSIICINQSVLYLLLFYVISVDILKPNISDRIFELIFVYKNFIELFENNVVNP